MQTEEPCDSLARCCVSLVLLCLFVSSSLLFFAISFLQLVFALDWFSSSLRAPLSSHCQCPNVSFSFPPLCVYSESLQKVSLSCLICERDKHVQKRIIHIFIYFFTMCMSASWYRCVVVFV